MVNAYLAQPFATALYSLYNPTHVGWFDPYWLTIQNNWVEFYTNRRGTLALLILNDFKKKFKETKVLKRKNFEGFEESLEQYRTNLLFEIRSYKINSIDKRRFFNYTRMMSVTAELEDRGLANCLSYLPSILPQKVTRNELELLVETFCYCFKHIVNTLTDLEVDKQKLEELGLPTTVEELRLLVETVRDPGELFDWHKTSAGFEWWSSIYLKRKGDFKYHVNEYLNSLHSELELPTRLAPIPTKGYTIKGLF
jgi:hypothetical protein